MTRGGAGHTPGLRTPPPTGVAGIRQQAWKAGEDGGAMGTRAFVRERQARMMSQTPASRLPPPRSYLERLLFSPLSGDTGPAGGKSKPPLSFIQEPTWNVRIPSWHGDGPRDAPERSVSGGEGSKGDGPSVSNRRGTERLPRLSAGKHLRPRPR